MNAYLGIPLDHPLADNSYDDLPVPCNGGLTFGQAGGKNELFPKGYYWYGWDNCHCDDISFYDVKERDLPDYKREHKAWTVKDVEEEIWYAVYTLKKLMRIAENAFAKGAGWRERPAATS